MIVQGIMKKMCMLIFALMSSVAGFTQVSEVKGVETKLVVYNGPEYSGREISFSGSQNPIQYSTRWFGYSFYNMNSIPVSVEAELYCVLENGREKLEDTKTFNLRSQETYVWKQENNSDFKVNYTVDGYYSSWRKEGKSEPGPWKSYYVKYKAYKIL